MAKCFKSDDKGVRAQLLKSDRIKLDLSADFNLAIDSDEIDLRKGMDDIENVLQVGPSFEVLLKENGNSRWFLNLPVRAVFEVGGEGVDYFRIQLFSESFLPTRYQYAEEQVEIWRDLWTSVWQCGLS